MIRFLAASFLSIALLASGLPGPAAAQVATPSYAQLAQRVVSQPVIVRAQIRKQTLAKPGAGEAPLPDGQVRLLLQARVSQVIAAPAAVPENISIVWQGPRDPKGKPPRLAKREGLMFLSAARGRDDLYGLVDTGNILPPDPAIEARVRAIAIESRGAAFAGLRLRGITEAFSQPDEPPFARRTVFFIATLSGKPVSLYLRAHGEDPMSDMILFTTSDFIATSEPVQPDSLAWFYLACTLPRSLPGAVLAEQPSEADAAFLEADYERIFAKLGPCQ